MRFSVLVASAAVALALTGCGKEQPAAEHESSNTTPATALTPPPATQAPAATAADREVAGLAPARQNKTTHRNEDGSETVEESGGDSGSHNSLLVAVASTMAAATPNAAAAAAAPSMSQWQEGANYTRLVPAQPTAAALGQVEVLEFFWYGCPHCYALDPQIEAWKKTKPAFVSFARVPVMWSAAHRSTARLYYTLESLGKLDQLNGEVFKEIHVNGDPLIGNDPDDTATAERMQTAFVKKFGISEDAFKQAYHSFAVETSLQRADQLVLRYRVEGVPTFVVNGKYVADVRSAGGPERLISLVNDLALQEHRH